MDTRIISLTAVVAATLVSASAAAQTMTDGDTVKLNGMTYRLWGIDASETSK
jgi:endonuclease YncB( thermonuclease family)